MIERDQFVVIVNSSKTMSEAASKLGMHFNTFKKYALLHKVYKPNKGAKGKPLMRELDHINGNSRDYRLDNLRILCPNCHSQTETYKSKNIKR